jgi:hypothetical protein
MQLVSFSMLMEWCSCCGVCNAVMRLGCGDEEGDARRGCSCVCADARACRNGNNPVFIACALGRVSCVEALIGANADVLQCDE